MSKKIDLIGQVYGRLTVLEDVGRRGSFVLWRCQCSCGNIVDVVSGQLRSGKTKSCGCLSQESRSKTHYKDLTGQKFGRLTVLEDVGRTHSMVVWRCLCECGNIVDVISNNLRKGNTQSCGCYNKERLSETHYQNLTGEVFGRLTVLEDVGRKGSYVLWKCKCNCGNIVDVTSYSLSSGKTQSCGCYHKERLSENFSGANNCNWKGGVTLLRDVVRKCTRYKEWRTQVFQRDNFICTQCSQRGGKLVAHHIIRFSKIMREYHITTFEEAIGCDPLWDIDNGITLCKKCHKQTHREMRDANKT